MNLLSLISSWLDIIYQVTTKCATITFHHTFRKLNAALASILAEVLWPAKGYFGWNKEWIIILGSCFSGAGHAHSFVICRRQLAGRCIYLSCPPAGTSYILSSWNLESTTWKVALIRSEQSFRKESFFLYFFDSEVAATPVSQQIPLYLFTVACMVCLFCKGPEILLWRRPYKCRFLMSI